MTRHRMRTAAAAALAGLCLASVLGTACARDAVKSSRERAPDNIGDADGLGAMIHVASAEEAARFKDEWFGTATEHQPRLEATDRVHRGERFSVLILYAGCAPRATDDAAFVAGKVPCDARLDLHLTDPTGRTTTIVNDASLANGQAAAPPGILQLSPVELQVSFDSGDPTGAYRFEAIVDDPDGDRVVRVATSVELLPDPPAP